MAILQHRKRVLGIYSPRMRRNSYLGTSGQKSDPVIRSGNLDFLYDRCISTTEWCLLDIFDVFMLLRRMTLWPWPLTFWPLLNVFVYRASHVWPTYQFLLFYDYCLLSYEYWYWSHFRYLKQSLRMRRVTWPLTGGKNSPHFWNPWPQFVFHFVTFKALRRRLSHVMGKNSVFPL